MGLPDLCGRPSDEVQPLVQLPELVVAPTAIADDLHAH